VEEEEVEEEEVVVMVVVAGCDLPGVGVQPTLLHCLSLC